MPAPNPIENALSRLMPSALSESGQRSIEALLDELAAAAPGTAATRTAKPWIVRRLVPFGIAATLATLLALAPRKAVITRAPLVHRVATAAQSGLVWVSESDRNEAKTVFSKDMIDAAILSDEGRLMEIINLQERTATFSNNDGRALVQREGAGYRVVINGPDKQVLFDGTLPTDGNLEGIPPDWRRRVWVLHRSLEHALDSRMVPVRSPRPQVVPPPVAPVPEGGGAPVAPPNP
ncbi:MAG: hypothetical protein WCO57_15580 [Verrucomicrobiota bacterium]